MRVLLTDNASNLAGAVAQHYYDILGIDKKATSGYRPQTNGTNERFNGTFMAMLRKYVDDRQSDWDVYINFMLFAYRTRVGVTRFSPFELSTGRTPNWPFQLEAGPLPNTTPSQAAYATELKKGLEVMLDITRTASEQAAQSRAGGSDDVRAPLYAPGDLVLVKRPFTIRSEATAEEHHQKYLSKKLLHFWTGPFRVIKVLEGDTTFEVAMNGRIGDTLVHWERMKEYKNPVAGPRLATKAKYDRWRGRTFQPQHPCDDLHRRPSRDTQDQREVDDDAAWHPTAEVPVPASSLNAETGYLLEQLQNGRTINLFHSKATCAGKLGIDTNDLPQCDATSDELGRATFNIKRSSLRWIPDLNGRSIMRSFPEQGDKRYKGVISGCNALETVDKELSMEWRVEYDDGDSEDLTTDEVVHLLVPITTDLCVMMDNPNDLANDKASWERESRDRRPEMGPYTPPQPWWDNCNLTITHIRGHESTKTIMEHSLSRTRWFHRQAEHATECCMPRDMTSTIAPPVFEGPELAPRCPMGAYLLHRTYVDAITTLHPADTSDGITAVDHFQLQTDAPVPPFGYEFTDDTNVQQGDVILLRFDGDNDVDGWGWCVGRVHRMVTAPSELTEGLTHNVRLLPSDNPDVPFERGVEEYAAKLTPPHVNISWIPLAAVEWSTPSQANASEHAGEGPKNIVRIVGGRSMQGHDTRSRLAYKIVTEHNMGPDLRWHIVGELEAPAALRVFREATRQAGFILRPAGTYKGKPFAGLSNTKR